MNFECTECVVVIFVYNIGFCLHIYVAVITCNLNVSFTI